METKRRAATPEDGAPKDGQDRALRGVRKGIPAELFNGDKLRGVVFVAGGGSFGV